MQRQLFSAIVAFGLLTQIAAAQDFSNVTSGLLLGIYAVPGQGGMRVTGIIPGYSAQGRLFHGDVLLRATIDGFTVYRLRSHYEMENAKMAIGANRQAAIEFWRPSAGLMYAWVEFTPLYGPAYSPVAQPYGAENPHKAEFKLESEKPGARELFQRGGGGAPGPQPGFQPQPGPQPVPQPVPPGGSGNPGDLFNR